MTSILCVKVKELTKDELLLKIFKKLKEKRESPAVVTNHNLHSLYFCLKNKELCNWINSQDIVHVDGMGIVYLSMLFFKKLKRAHRVTYLDFVYDLFNHAQENNLKIFYLGTNQQSLEKGIEKLKSQYPKLNIQGRNGFFSEAENEDIVSQINNFKPDILFVGMGMPRQELWVKDNVHKLNSKTVFLSGAVMDLISGAIKTPPRWSGSAGFEWAFRLFYYPKQLWKRYFLEPIYIAIRIVLWPFWK